MDDVIAHPSAEISQDAQVGPRTRVWHNVQIREGARIGSNCIIGRNCYVDEGVVLGDNIKVQSNVSIYRGVTLENGVFVGPHVCFTNDLRPRAVNPDGSLKGADDWTITHTLVREGAAIGAHSVLVAGVTVGRWAMIGSGSVVTRDVPDHALVFGNPARRHAWVCKSGHTLTTVRESADEVTGNCEECHEHLTISLR